MNISKHLLFFPQMYILKDMISKTISHFIRHDDESALELEKAVLNETLPIIYDTMSNGTMTDMMRECEMTTAPYLPTDANVWSTAAAVAALGVLQQYLLIGKLIVPQFLEYRYFSHWNFIFIKEYRFY